MGWEECFQDSGRVQSQAVHKIGIQSEVNQDMEQRYEDIIKQMTKADSKLGFSQTLDLRRQST
jgi:hypothetical protein